MLIAAKEDVMITLFVWGAWALRERRREVVPVIAGCSMSFSGFLGPWKNGLAVWMTLSNGCSDRMTSSKAPSRVMSSTTAYFSLFWSSALHEVKSFSPLACDRTIATTL